MSSWNCVFGVPFEQNGAVIPGLFRRITSKKIWFPEHGSDDDLWFAARYNHDCVSSIHLTVRCPDCRWAAFDVFELRNYEVGRFSGTRNTYVYSDYLAREVRSDFHINCPGVAENQYNLEQPEYLDTTEEEESDGEEALSDAEDHHDTLVIPGGSYPEQDEIPEDRVSSSDEELSIVCRLFENSFDFKKAGPST
uniref:Uncharacterized protein n=1 Tax=Pistacia sobemo-like virus TaxID=2794233 RepID=A0A7T0M7X8_9VIRU|nr:hypothetical protein [Pistacia sobemo-like virus]